MGTSLCVTTGKKGTVELHNGSINHRVQELQLRSLSGLQNVKTMWISLCAKTGMLMTIEVLNELQLWEHECLLHTCT